MTMNILAIETSCDETAVALLEVKNGQFKILANFVSSQINIHRKYGGVVPEVAARTHLETIIPLLKKLPKSAKIDYLAVTYGPGLVTSLLIGLETAKTLSFVWQKPLIAINHLEGHLYANWLSPQQDKIKFPALGLIVSGGHTELVLMKNHLSYKKVGETLDDAAGECFDKVAKLLKIGYPGGPIISRLATQGNPDKYNLPRPMFYSKDYNFSFSGLKTAVLYKLKEIGNQPEKFLPDFCASFQQAVIDVLIKKTLGAAEKYKVKSIILGGGVVANGELREQLEVKVKEKLPSVFLSIPELKFCTDNAVMIAVASYFHITCPVKLPIKPQRNSLKADYFTGARKDFTDCKNLETNPNLEL